MAIEVRKGTVQDAALACEIYRRAVMDGAAAHYSEAERRAWLGDGPADWMAERLATGRVWVAVRDGHDEGLLAAKGLEASGDVHLDLFFVLPEAQGTGVAADLYESFERAALGRVLTAYASRGLRPFLERRGWRMVRPDPSVRNGVRLMRWQMEKPPT